MANAVDERIVEARFDSTQFEKGVQKTVDKLEELKKALNLKDTDKTVTDFAKTASDGMEKVGSTLDKLSNRLTTFKGMIKQQILGGLASEISNVVLSIERSLHGLVNQLGSQQMHAGMAKYTDLLTSVRTLTVGGIGEEKAYDKIQRFQLYSDQTNASLEQMVGLMTKIKTSGADIDTATKMVEGFSNAAFSLGVNMSYLPNLYMNFAQAYGKGSMKLEDWKTFQSFNMVGEEFRDKILDAAVAVGTLTRDSNGLYQTSKKVNKAVKSSKKFSKDQWEAYLSTGFFDKKVMEEVFGKFYYFDKIKQAELDAIEDMSEEQRKAYFEKNGLDEWAYKAFKAGQEARSLTDVLNTLKNAISTGWSNTFEIIFGKLDKATELFTAMADSELVNAIRRIGEFRNEVLTAWGVEYHYDEELEDYVGIFEKGQTGRDYLLQALKNIDDMIGIVRRGLATIGFKEFNDQLEKDMTFPEALGRRLGYLSKSFKEFTDKIMNIFTVEEEIDGVTKRVLKPEYIERFGKIKNGLTAIFGILTKLGGIITSTIGKVFFKIQPIMDAIADGIGRLMKPLIDLNSNPDKRSFFDNITHAIDNLLAAVDPLIEPLTKVISFLGDIGAIFLQTHIDAISTMIEIFGDALGLLVELFGGISSQRSKDGIDIIEKWRDKVKKFGDACKEGLRFIKDFFVALFDDIKKLLGIGKTGSSKQGGAFENIINFFKTNTFIQKVKDWIAQAISDIGKWIQDIPNKIKNFGIKVSDFIHNLFYTKDDNGKEVETAFSKWLKQTVIAIGDWLKTLPGKIWNGIKIVAGAVGDIVTIVTDFLFGQKRSSSGSSQETGFIQSIKDWFAQLIVDIRAWIKDVPNKIRNIGIKIGDFFHNLFYTKDDNGKEVETAFSKWLKQTAKNIASWVKTLPGKILNVIKKVGNAAGNILLAVSEFLFGKKSNSKNGKQQVAVTKSWFSQWIEDVVQSVKDWVKTIPDKVSKIWKTIVDFIFGEEVTRTKVDPKTGNTVQITERVKTGFSQWLDETVNAALEWIKGIPEKVVGLWNKIISYVFGKDVNPDAVTSSAVSASANDPKTNTLTTGISNWIDNVIKYLGGTFIPNVLKFGKDIWDTVMSNIFGIGVNPNAVNPEATEKDPKTNTLTEGITTWITNAVDYITGPFLNDLVVSITSLWDGIIGAIFGTTKDSEGKDISLSTQNPEANASDPKTQAATTGISNWINNFVNYLTTEFPKALFDTLRGIWDVVMSFMFGEKVEPDPIDVTNGTAGETQRQSVIQTLLEWLKGTAAKVGQWVKSVPDLIGNIWDQIIKAIFGSEEQEEKKYGKYLDDTDPVMDVVKDHFEKPIKKSKTTEKSGFIASAETFIAGIAVDVGKIISGLPEAIIQNINFGINVIDDLLKGITDWFSDQNKRKALLEGSSEEIQKAIAEENGNSAEAVKASGFVTAITGLGQALWKTITETIPGFLTEAWTFVKNNGGDWLAIITEWFDTHGVNWSTIEGYAVEIGQKTAAAISSIPTYIDAAVAGIKALVNANPEFEKTKKDLQKQYENGLLSKEDMERALAYSEKQIKDTPRNKIGDAVKEIGKSFKDAFVQVGPYIIDGLNSALQWIGKGLTYATDFLTNRDKSETIMESVEKKLTGEGNGEENNTELVASMSRLGETIKSAITTTIPNFVKAGIEELKVQIPKLLSGAFDLFGSKDVTEEAGKAMEKSLSTLMGDVDLAGVIRKKLAFWENDSDTKNAPDFFENVTDGMSEFQQTVGWWGKSNGKSTTEQGTKNVTNMLDGFGSILSGFGNLADKVGDNISLVAIALIVMAISKLVDQLSVIDDIGYTLKWGAINTLVKGVFGLIAYLAYLSATGNDVEFERMTGLLKDATDFIKELAYLVTITSTVKTIAKSVKGTAEAVNTVKSSGGFLKGLGSSFATGISNTVLGGAKMIAYTAAGVSMADMVGEAVSGLGEDAAETLGYLDVGLGSMLDAVNKLVEIKDKIGTAREAITEMGGIFGDLEKLFLSEESLNYEAAVIAETAKNEEMKEDLYGDGQQIFDPLMMPYGEKFISNITDGEKKYKVPSLSQANQAIHARMTYYSTLAAMITQLSGSIANFKTAIATDQYTDTRGVTEALQTIIGMQEQMETFGEFATKEAFQNFKLGIMGIGSAMRIYSLGASEIPDGDIDTTYIHKAVEILGSLFGDQELYSLIDKIGGEVANADELVKNSESVVIFAGALTMIGDACKDITDNTRGNIQDLVNLVTGIEISKDSGESATELAQRFGEIGNAIGTFAINTVNLNEQNLESALRAIEVISNMSVKLKETEDTGLFAKLFLGDKSIGNFAVNVALLGTKIADFFNSIQGFNGKEFTYNAANTQQVMMALSSLSGFASSLAWGGKEKFDFGEKAGNLTEFGKDISGFFNEINQYSLGDKRYDFDFVSQTIDLINRLGTMFGNVSATFITEDLFEKMATVGSILKGDNEHFGLRYYIGDFYDEMQRVIIRNTYSNLDDAVSNVSKLLDAYFKFVSIIVEIQSNFKNSVIQYDDKSEGKASDIIYSMITLIGNINGNTKEIDALLTTAKKWDATGLTNFQTFADGLYHFVSAVSGFAVERNWYSFDAVNRGLHSLLTINWEEFSLIKDRIIDALGKNDAYEAGRLIGINIDIGIASGFNPAEGKTAAVNAYKDIMRAFGASYNEGAISCSAIKDDGRVIGENLDRGLANGINSGHAISAAQQLAGAISGAFTVSWRVHSPSRLFKEFGEYLDLGLEQGIDEASDGPIDAASVMAEASVNNVRSILEGIRDLAIDEMDFTPTITPVVDMTNIDAASAAIRGMGFGGLPFAFDMAGLNASAQFANPDYGRETVNTDYSGAINSIRGDITALGNRISEISEGMRGMRIMLDSGAIVGGIINEVDSRLGRLGFYAGREG